VPTHKFVLFGHHFASIAGAGPIVGPAIAVVWGWLPALLWVWFGNLFIGSIHDYLSLMASVRYDGKSIQYISGKLTGESSKYIFEVYVYFALWLASYGHSSIFQASTLFTGFNLFILFLLPHFLFGSCFSLEITLTHTFYEAE
jgi:carbon starvation protein